jgi:hypothetical protein
MEVRDSSATLSREVLVSLNSTNHSVEVVIGKAIPVL